MGKSRFLVVASVVASVFVVTACGSFEQKELGSDVSLEGNTIEKEDDKTIDDYSPKENLYLAASVLEKAGSFRTETVGKSTSMEIFSNEVYARRIVCRGEVFKESKSYSAFVKLATQTFVYNGNYLLREKKSMSSISEVVWKDEIEDIGQDEYLSRYGIVPGGVCAYVLNDDSILSASLIKKSDDGYTFKYELDNDVATYYIKREMKCSASLDNLPVFEKISVTVTMDKEWKIISINYDGIYRVDKFLGITSTCNETLTEKFYDIGTVTDYPERALFISHCKSAL